MKDLLGTARTITVNGKQEAFENFDRLTAWIDGYIRIMAELETALDTPGNDHAQTWDKIARIADTIGPYLAAQDEWLADHDASISGEIAEVRRSIRNFNDLTG
jgi:hypothetical protein